MNWKSLIFCAAACFWAPLSLGQEPGDESRPSPPLPVQHAASLSQPPSPPEVASAPAGPTRTGSPATSKANILHKITHLQDLKLAALMNNDDPDPKIDVELSLLKETLRELDTPARVSWWSVDQAMTISAAVLIFGLFVLLIAAFLILHGCPSQEVLRILGTVLILVSAIFLVVAGYSDTQIAPVMGLLGTIVGYLLGKEISPAQKPAPAALVIPPATVRPDPAL